MTRGCDMRSWKIRLLRRYRDTRSCGYRRVRRRGPVQSAKSELVRGIRGMLNRNLRVESRVAAEAAIVLGTVADLRQSAPQLAPAGNLEVDGFWLRTVRTNGTRFIVITGQNERGVLYGSFALLRKIALGESVADLDQKEIRTLRFAGSITGKISMDPSNVDMAGGPSSGKTARRGRTSAG